MKEERSMIIIFILVATIFILLLIAFIVGILFRYRRKQLSYKQGLETLKVDFEKNLLSTQLEVQEQTFQNIAQEIHDNIGLSLTLAKLNLNTLDLKHTVSAEEKVEASVDLIGKAIDDLRDISRSLNSDIIADQGLIKALDQEINKLKKLSIYTVDYNINGNPVFLDSQKELVLLRIAQEAFNNTIKHANARSIHVTLNYKQDTLTLQIKDDGSGFLQAEAQSKNNAGLLNMKNRAVILNGSCNITSIPSVGTTVEVTVPF